MKQYLDHVERSVLRTEEIKSLYDRANTRMITLRVTPWTVEQLEEARLRQQLEMQADAYFNGMRYNSDKETEAMANTFADHATVRTPATIVPSLAMKVALEVIEARKAGRPAGITGFQRDVEWSSDEGMTAKLDEEGNALFNKDGSPILVPIRTKKAASSAQRSLKSYLEANGFRVAQTTKHLDAETAPLEVVGYVPLKQAVTA